ncbi:phage head-tail connector protein [Rhizobium sp. N324]|uniref:phage head-tail connector protein n=1 Tax=Rhizobium sp. N324 TaxID=1703969 RepID=UPI0007EA3974|nr:phage head-tail connector protein [Rhizobium sp. N324]ANM12050.1 hypothetical protein AMK05_CH03701 [Rhizobium sp. N324]
MGFRIITTVLTPASSADLVTLSDVKAELGLTGGGDDAVLKRYLAGASLAIAQYCNRTFVQETVKDEIWPDREFYAFQVAGSLSDIQLSRWPLSGDVTVTENGDALTSGTDFRVDAKTGIATRIDTNAYPREWQAWPLSFTYTAGYSSIPADVQDAAIRMVKARYMARGRDPFLRSENIPGVRDVSYWIATGSDAGNMPPDVADILDNYRQPVVQ